MIPFYDRYLVPVLYIFIACLLREHSSPYINAVRKSIYLDLEMFFICHSRETRGWNWDGGLTTHSNHETFPNSHLCS